MQASNFGGTFDQLFLRIFLENFHRRCLSTSSIPWCKKVENDQKLKSRGGSCLKNQFLGHIVSGTSLKPDPEKLTVVQKRKTPTSVTEVRQFLGFTNYFRRFIDHYSFIARPLEELTGKYARFSWSKQCHDAFAHLTPYLCKRKQRYSHLRGSTNKVCSFHSNSKHYHCGRNCRSLHPECVSLTWLKTIVCDRDTRFTADFFKEIFGRLRVVLKFSTAQHPQTDISVCWLIARGAVSALYSFLKHGHDWCVCLPV